MVLRAYASEKPRREAGFRFWSGVACARVLHLRIIEGVIRFPV